ncbi:acyl transferase/acyl hydrolase/lysophospholipase [Xylogone sp. PMI_703]|nr:acyl transferase/acyl hydrolase/lysophospholipase [Xylogone sp. PMI_703]
MEFEKQGITLDSKLNRPLCVLSLGLSELLIIREIMHRLQKLCDAPSLIRPADIFHMIGGTSTGGLIALLLGRLQLDADEAISQYCAIASDVFTTSKAAWKDGRFKASALEKAIKGVIEKRLGRGHADDLMYDTKSDNLCKTFVCAMNARHLDKNPTKFRTWSARKDSEYNCKIWEAARATSAAPQLFKRILIGEPFRQQEFVDGALGCNNPIQQVIEETVQEFESDCLVGCVLSIGTGTKRVPGFERPRGYQRLIPKDLIKAIAKMTTDGNSEADYMAEKFRDYNRLYFRLNAGIELGDIGLDESARLGDVESHTMAYLRNKEISRKIDYIVEALRGKPTQTLPLRSPITAIS